MSAYNTETPKNEASWLKLPVQCVILVFLVFFIYNNTTKNQYAVDDLMVIGRNEFTQKGFQGIPDILTHDSFYGFWRDNKDFANRFYRPISLITFAIEKGVLKEMKPSVSHAINFIIYAITVACLAVVVNRYLFPGKPLLAFMVLLLFTVHPVHTEVVTNVKGRDEGLALLFLSLSMWGLFAYVEKKNNLVLGGSLLAYLLALLTKENGLSYLGVVPLTLYCFTDLKLPRIATIAGFFFATFGLYMAIRMSVIGLNLGVAGTSVLDNFYYGRSFEEKYATIIYVLGFYITLLFYPHPLSWDYSFNEFSYKSFSNPLVILSILVHLALLGWAFWKIKDKHPVAYGILFYFGTLFVVSNLVINIGGYIGERFLFQPSFGFSVAIAYLLYWFWKNGPVATPSARGALVSAFFIPAIFLGCYKTFNRNKDWKDGYTLTLKDVNACPNSAKTNGAAGGQLVEMANVEQDPQVKTALLDQAIPYLTRAVELYPGFAQAAMELGTAYYLKKDYENAKKYYLQSEKANPENPILKINLCSLYDEIATIENNKGNAKKALELELLALKYNPKNANSWTNLGVFYCANDIKEYNKGLEAFLKAVELEPTKEDYKYNLGYGYFMAGKFEEAYKIWKGQADKDPNNTKAQNALSSIPEAYRK